MNKIDTIGKKRETPQELSNLNNYRKETLQQVESELLPEKVVKKILAFNNKFSNENFHVDVCEDEGRVSVFNNGIEIGKMESGGTIPVDSFEADGHNIFEVDNQYRGRGIGKFLYEIYSDMNEKNPKAFPIPDTEYANKRSAILFYLYQEIYNEVYKYNEDTYDWEEISIYEIENQPEEDLEALYMLIN